MPVVAVVAAIAIDGLAVSAAVAGTLTTLSAITAIGATMSAIGSVTHNKTLTLVGAGLGLVGGIGSLAFGSDALGNVSDLFGSSSAGGASAAETAAAVGDGGAAGGAAESAYQPGAISASDLPGAGTDITTATGAINQTALSPAGAINATSIAPATGNAAAIEAGGQTGSALAGSLSPPVTPTLPDFNPTGLNTAIQGAVGKLPDMVTPPTGLLNWAHNNQTLAYGVLQAGGSFISGLTNPMTPAQIDALNAQAEANRATAAVLKREAANQGQAMPTVTGMPTATGGLINSNPVRAPLITGAPNTGAPATSLMGTA